MEVQILSVVPQHNTRKFTEYGGMTELGLLCVPAKNCALKRARGFESLFHRQNTGL
jgi:hypothetical protein